MLRKRLIASFLLICPVLAIFWLDTRWNLGWPGLWSAPVVLLFSFVIAGELATMIRERTAGAIPWVTHLGAILCHLAMILPALPGLTSAKSMPSRWEWSAIALVVTLIAAFLHELRLYGETRAPVPRVGLTMFCVLYSGWLLSFLVAMRIEQGNERGALALFSVLFIIKMSDAGAYFVGKRWGKMPLAPVLSPGKTVEGLFGGIVAGVLAAGVLFAVARQAGIPTNWLAACGYAISITIVGVFGDLCESMIKREMGCKDSSGWLPGLGGIMDTADSVLLAAPIAYLWWRWGAI